ncbi:GNAT family acetyltransferase [Ceratobasidium sp. AG-Ba]|nr:GNAT family acetyltransferase [Ceratobasidium sp. AG-Ba]
MPSRQPTLNVVVLTHTTATDFLDATEHILQEHSLTSNIIYPFAIKARASERLPVSNARGPAYWSAPRQAPTKAPRQFWLTQWTSRGASTVAPPTLDFVVAVTDNQFGGYPVFFWSPHPSSDMTNAFLSVRIQAMITHLLRAAPAERVFSVFGQDPVVEAFTSMWTQYTGKIPEQEVFYAAKFSFCTPKTLLPAPALAPGHALRLATPADLEQCAQLCKEFADDSVYFGLSLSDARIQAQSMIGAKQLWVYDTPQGIATIVASTRRTTDAVASINKVYTPPAHRGKGCARALVAHVTNALLSGADGSSKHYAVVLYVGHDNSAARVYHRVGYQGLSEDAPRPREVENWLEIGFQGTNRGHW